MENISPTPKKRNPLIFIAPVAIGAAAFFGIRSFVHGLNYETTDNAQIETRAVPVISRVSGYIDSIGTDDFGKVSAHQVLIKIDDQEFALAVVQAKADLLNAQADLANAEASLRNAQANQKLASANADVQQSKVDKAKSDLNRDDALFKDNAITQKQLDDTRSTFDAGSKQYIANQQQVNLAATQVSTAQVQIQKAKALIETRQALLDQAKLKLSYCTITAPVTGRIGKRGIETGQYIQAGAPLFAVVSDEKYWIVANFKETQLEKMNEGQAVDIHLDGYPDVDIKGKISSFSQATGAKFALLPPDNATGNFVKVTQRVPVKIELIDADKYKDILRAGLSAEVEVNIN